MAAAVKVRTPDDLPRIVGLSRVFVHALAFLVAGGFIIAIVQLIAGAEPNWTQPISFGLVFMILMLIHLGQLRVAGPRTNASVRLVSESSEAGISTGHRMRTPGELWRDFPLFVSSRVAVRIASAWLVFDVIITIIVKHSIITTGIVERIFVVVVFGVVFLAAWFRYRRLRDVDFAIEPQRVIHVVAALLVDAEGRALMVRKRGTTKFMQPGGKPEPGESGPEALSRELKEELGLMVVPEQLTLVGTYRTAAANEEDTLLIADVYDAPVVSHPVEAAAEIDEVLWVDPSKPDYVEFAPLSSEELLPLLAERKAGAQHPSPQHP